MSFIFKALWRSQKKLILFFFGFVLYEYYFSIIGYTFFWTLYNGYCDDLWICFIATIDETFKKYGSIGAFLKDPHSSSSPYVGVDHENEQLYFAKFFFDNIQYILLPLIMRLQLN